MAVVASAVVFFAASGFILINVGDKTAQRELTLSQTPAVEAARRALQDAKTARDRECTRVGPVCRDRENAVATRQNELNAAMAKAGTAASVRADPQATALHIDPVTLRLPQTRVLVTMCFVGRVHVEPRLGARVSIALRESGRSTARRLPTGGLLTRAADHHPDEPV
jgi:hypothetical protein